MTELSKRIINTIKHIPAGKVLTYGAVASISGNHRAARQVSWLLKSQSSKLSLPWHRVISSKGIISIKDHGGYELQKELLLAEGVQFNHREHIDLEVYMWNGISIDNLESSH